MVTTGAVSPHGRISLVADDSLPSVLRIHWLERKLSISLRSERLPVLPLSALPLFEFVYSGLQTCQTWTYT